MIHRLNKKQAAEKMVKTMNNDENSSSASFKLCQAKGQVFRVAIHIPVIGENFRRTFYGSKKILGTEDGRKILKAAVKAGDPFMAARFGTSEGAAFVEHWRVTLKYGDSLESYSKHYNDFYLNQICCYSGFFPNDTAAIQKWAELETEACRDLDLLGVMQFLNEEWVVRTLCPQAKLMHSSGFASASKGWTHILEGKKVLVVHPFTDTIQKQYRDNREKIFPGTNALPLFDLKCVKAVQTIADQTDERFATWFDALDYMTEEIAKQDFEVCLIGCGAYGFPLASRVKRMGKVAIHMGGSLQTLFGIRGSRWDVKYSDMYNDAWVYPSKEETPKGFEKVEGGCYWK